VEGGTRQTYSPLKMGGGTSVKKERGSRNKQGKRDEIKSLGEGKKTELPPNKKDRKRVAWGPKVRSGAKKKTLKFQKVHSLQKTWMKGGNE